MRYAVPVFLINGFLESGKTSFINNAILSDPEVKKSRTLIILCEEGEVEPKEQKNLFVYRVDGRDFLTESLLSNLRKQYNPDRVIIEFNCMWGMDALYDLRLPKDWRYAEQLTLIDATTFDGYYNNMRNIFFELFQSSATVVFNRCDRENTNFAQLRTRVKTVNPDAEIMYSDDKGLIDLTFEDELPYSLNDEIIELDDDSYTIWYIDVMENPERYKGKKIAFEGLVAKPKKFREFWFVPGKHVMTCCEDDIAFLGYACRWEEGGESLRDYDKIQITAVVDYRFCPEYGDKGPVLYATEVKLLERKG
ncbi:MAG: GTPase [Clostridia bacterium]|nr:GTPase [Clostridia bacterium]